MLLYDSVAVSTHTHTHTVCQQLFVFYCSANLASVEKVLSHAFLNIL